MDARLELSRIVSSLQKRIDNLRTFVKAEERIIIALAGVPGSGKSTISGALVQQLRSVGIDDVVVVPMVRLAMAWHVLTARGSLNHSQDGFHLTKAELLKLAGPQETMCRRGAPFTFDANAFVSAAEILRHSPVTGTESECPAFKVPSFDHAVQDPIKDDIAIPTWIKVVILEGNYTLLDISPWKKIANLAHEK